DQGLIAVRWTDEGPDGDDMTCYRVRRENIWSDVENTTDLMRPVVLNAKGKIVAKEEQLFPAVVKSGGQTVTLFYSPAENVVFSSWPFDHDDLCFDLKVYSDRYIVGTTENEDG